MHLNFMVCDESGATLQACEIHRAWAQDILQPLIGQYGVLTDCSTSDKVRKLHAEVDNAWLNRTESQIEFGLIHQAGFYSALAMQVVIFSTQARNSIDRELNKSLINEKALKSNVLNNAHRRLGYVSDLLRLLVLSMQGGHRFIVETVREEPKQ